MQLLPERAVGYKQHEEVILKQGGEAGGVHYDLLDTSGLGLLKTRHPGHLGKLRSFEDNLSMIFQVPDAPLPPILLREVCKALDLRLRPQEYRLEPFHPRLRVMGIITFEASYSSFYLCPSIISAEVSRRGSDMLL